MNKIRKKKVFLKTLLEISFDNQWWTFVQMIKVILILKAPFCCCYFFCFHKILTLLPTHNLLNNLKVIKYIKLEL